ncbi:MAG: hypothetical protein Kow00127_00870 [Bacteroidales bacterium]
MRPSEKYLNKLIYGILPVILILFAAGCQEVDETPPVITLLGDENMVHILNQPFTDPGATALDETDGDVSDRIFTASELNVNRIGTYEITYSVTDNSGNEAAPAIRTVQVINEAWTYAGEWSGAAIPVFPEGDTCLYPTAVYADSTVNWRIRIPGMDCRPQVTVYADISDSLLVIAFQTFADSVETIIYQGFGAASDSLITIDYSRTSGEVINYLHGELSRK